ncbi:unnamed protein product, partial [Didymodactylos carnosus]
KRFDEVHEDTQNIWHHQQYLYMREYFDRPPFIAPFNLVFDVYDLLLMLYNRIQKARKIPTKQKLKIFINQEVGQKWTDFEGACTYEYAHGVVSTTKILDNSKLSNQDRSLSVAQEIKSSDDSMSKDNGSNETIKQMRDDINKVNQSLEEIKTRLIEVIIRYCV